MDAVVMANRATGAVTVVASLPLDLQWRTISEEMKGIIDRLLLEKLSLAGIEKCVANFRTVGATVRQSKV